MDNRTGSSLEWDRVLGTAKGQIRLPSLLVIPFFIDVFYEHDIGRDNSARAGHCLSIARPVKAEYLIDGEFGKLFWGAAFNSLTPYVCDAVFFVEIYDCLSIRRPSVLLQRNVEQFRRLTAVEGCDG